VISADTAERRRSDLLFPAILRASCFLGCIPKDPPFRRCHFAGLTLEKAVEPPHSLESTLRMVADGFRVLLQSGAGKFLLGLLAESFRNWWRRR
jgi:hypothetical protein